MLVYPKYDRRRAHTKKYSKTNKQNVVRLRSYCICSYIESYKNAVAITINQFQSYRPQV